MTPKPWKNFTIVGPNQLTVMTPWQNLSFAVVTSVTYIKLLLFLTKQPWLFWLYLTGGAPPPPTTVVLQGKSQREIVEKSPRKVEDLIASSTAQDTPSNGKKWLCGGCFFVYFFGRVVGHVNIGNPLFDVEMSFFYYYLFGGEMLVYYLNLSFIFLCMEPFDSSFLLIVND